VGRLSLPVVFSGWACLGGHTPPAMDDNIICTGYKQRAGRSLSTVSCLQLPWGRVLSPEMVTMPPARGMPLWFPTRARETFHLAMDRDQREGEPWRLASDCPHPASKLPSPAGHAGVDTTYLDVRRRQLRRQLKRFSRYDYFPGMSPRLPCIDSSPASSSVAVAATSGGFAPALPLELPQGGERIFPLRYRR